MSGECPECGLDTYWQGGIKPSICIQKQNHPLCHVKSVRARKHGQVEAIAAATALVREEFNQYEPDGACGKALDDVLKMLENGDWKKYLEPSTG